MEKKFVCYFYLVSWKVISFGFHVCFKNPNIEIHLPFGFIRMGWEDHYPGEVLPVAEGHYLWGWR